MMTNVEKLAEKLEQAGSIWLFDQDEDMPLTEATGERLTANEQKLLIAVLIRWLNG